MGQRDSFQGKFLKYSELNEKNKIKHIMAQLWDAIRATLRRELTAINAYIRNRSDLKSVILNFFFVKLEKEEQIKPKQAEGNNENKSIGQ